MDPKKVATKDLTLSMSLVITRFLLDSDSMHYGFWSEDLEVNFLNLGRAQERFDDYLIRNIPDGTRRILEVGCGSGELAAKLTRQGYHVDCVVPGAYLAATVQGKLGDAGKVHACPFEELSTTETYDLVLFSESFHYINLELLFRELPGLLVDGGHVLVCDFFKNYVKGKCAIGGGHMLNKFEAQLATSEFACVKDEDITRQTAPTIDVLGGIYEQVGVPFRDLLQDYMKSSHPILSRLGGPIMRRFYGRKLDKFNRKLTPGLVCADHFAKFKTYRLFLLQRKQAESAAAATA